MRRQLAELTVAMFVTHWSPCVKFWWPALNFSLISEQESATKDPLSSADSVFILEIAQNRTHL